MCHNGSCYTRKLEKKSLQGLQQEREKKEEQLHGLQKNVNETKQKVRHPLCIWWFIVLQYTGNHHYAVGHVYTFPSPVFIPLVVL